MKKFDPGPIIGLCQLILPLEWPLRVKIYGRRIRGFPDSSGICYAIEYGSNFVHVIEATALENNRGVENVLAHEYVHAWIHENHPKAENHKRTFQRVAKRLEKGLQLLGVETGELYRRDLDK